ncbi:MAG: NfeD family protein [Acholeplasmatales bacterium]|nr:NfeD family protein [Acholeplasmatales bacterium]
MFLAFDIEAYTIWFWLAAFVFTIILEAITQDFVSVWFAAGSFATLCICYFAPWWVEVIVFLVISVVSLIATRPLVKKLMRSQIRKTNSDEFIGQRVKLLKDTSKFESGEVKINSIIYTAVLPDDSDEEIKADSIVEIVSIKGNKVIIRKVESE